MFGFLCVLYNAKKPIFIGFFEIYSLHNMCFENLLIIMDFSILCNYLILFENEYLFVWNNFFKFDIKMILKINIL